MTLQECYARHSSPVGHGDKGSYHNYLPTYEREMTLTGSLDLLEIGVFYGESLLMWAEFFPEAMIHGIDIHITEPAAAITNERIVMHRGDACIFDPTTAYLRQIPWDYIIDDGSHRVEDQISALVMFWNSLKPGGKYFIEDIQGQEALDNLIEWIESLNCKWSLYDGRCTERPKDELLLVLTK